MGHKRKTPHFFLVVDDGGFDRALPCGRGAPVRFAAYENLLRLAKDFGIQVVLACTTSFLDLDRVTPRTRPHADSRRLVDFLERNHDHIRVADHGYSHQWGDRYVEFYDYRTGEVRPAAEQERHIEWSRRIYRSLGWRFPEIFVAPGHGWEPGVTDRLYAERGCRFLTSMLWLKRPLSKTGLPAPGGFREIFRPWRIYPEVSDHLLVLPRLGLLIPADYDSPGRSVWLRARLAVLSRSRLISYLLHRHPAAPPHNYMAHIMNFTTEQALRGWERFLRRIASRVRLASTFEESVALWREGSSFSGCFPSPSCEGGSVKEGGK